MFVKYIDNIYLIYYTIITQIIFIGIKFIKFIINF